MSALLMPRRPPLRCHGEQLANLAPLGTHQVSMLTVSVPKIDGRRLTLAVLLAALLHVAGVFWLRNSAPAQPLPEPNRPLPIAMQLVAPPKPPVMVAAPTEPAQTEAAQPEPAKPEAPQAPAIEKPSPLPPEAKPQPTKNPVPIKRTPPPKVPSTARADPAPAPPPPVREAAPAAISEPRSTAPIGRAGYLNNPPPVYPPAAARRRQEGNTLLRVHVLASGRPDAVDVAKSSGFPALDEAAMAAVRQWTFTPAKRGDTPVDGWVNVPLAFKLAP